MSTYIKYPNNSKPIINNIVYIKASLFQIFSNQSIHLKKNQKHATPLKLIMINDTTSFILKKILVKHTNATTNDVPKRE